MTSLAATRIVPLLALALAGCNNIASGREKAGEAVPFSFEDVDFSADCSPNAAFDRLLTVLQPPVPAVADNAVPVIDEPLYNSLSGAEEHVLHLGHEVEWHGLRLVEVRLYQGIESGPTNHSLVFADSPERVRAVWNARGWNLPAVGETRTIDDEVIWTAVGIEADGDLTAVTCFVD